MAGKFNDTDIDFDEWSRAPYNHNEVDRELQIQKKRQYPEDLKPPYPKPVIKRVNLKPIRSVSFHDPVVQQPETYAVEPLSQGLQHTQISTGAD